MNEANSFKPFVLKKTSDELRKQLARQIKIEFDRWKTLHEIKE
jgi:hypothetical protein